jgi:hypothetical protein
MGMLMRRFVLVAAVLTGAVTGLAGLSPVLSPAHAASPAAEAPTVFNGVLTPAQLKLLQDSGVDRSEITAVPKAGAGGRVQVEVVLSKVAAQSLTAKGVPLAEKKIDGVSASTLLRAQAVTSPSVFRSYSEPGGLKDEFTATATKNPSITKLETIGRSVNGQPIIALKVTKDARTTRDGARPAVLYVSAQHAREWITPEMTRRLMHTIVDGYATNSAIRKLVNSTELWFVPTANPDGYDYTFTEGNRLWRKNLRDNDGDGQITGSDGVDPNRNFPTKWGYDNEGSSGTSSSETYRGTAPASEPETKALNGLLNRIRFTHLVNYHSAAELLLYGTGWQVATPTPDDTLFEAQAGDDATPAVPGYDPDINAELYTTNGETTEHASTTYKTLSYTPEMSTCETASDADPNDAFDAADCLSVFNFPDSEPLVQAEFAKNLPFALSVAQSAQDPDDPVSVVGRTAPDFVVDSFTTSYGSPQPVAVTARRALKDLTLHYSINGKKPKDADVKEWKGGERYGDTGDAYYAEYRGVVTGASPGDKVKVWFTGERAGPGSSKVTRRTSPSFTYTLAKDTSAKVLVLANEDYEGVNPTYPASVTAPKYATTYTDALQAKGLSSAVWDVSKQGVPHHLGVLGHFKAVVWYLGDNRLTQDPEDEEINVGGDELADLAVAERQQYLTIAVRDYLNEGGKLVHTGETAAYYGQLASLIGGIYYGLDGAPSTECSVTVDLFSDCLLLADDFSQYYLGAYGRSSVTEPQKVTGTSAPLTGITANLGGPAVADNPLDEAGNFTITSSVLPVAQFPQFTSKASASYVGAGGGAFDPVEGSWYVGTLHADDTYTRLGRTVDLAAVTAGQAPSLDFALSFDTEVSYDNVIVEAHTPGADDWTTLAEKGGLSNTGIPQDCGQGFLLAEHPFLEHYLTLTGSPDDPATTCTATGTSGAWNRLTGNSGGWKQVSFDLSAYAGKQVEVAISYVTDPGGGGAGVFIDDTRITVGGAATQAEGFEAGLGVWTVQPPPAGSPTPSLVFARAQTLFSAAVTTPDTVLLGFGVEQLATPAERATVLGAAVRSLIR